MFVALDQYQIEAIRETFRQLRDYKGNGLTYMGIPIFIPKEPGDEPDPIAHLQGKDILKTLW